MNRRLHRSLATGALGATALLSIQQAKAQEALTASRSAYQAAANRSRTAEAGGYAHTGQSVSYTLGASLGFEYNDNVNLSEVAPEDDFSVRPNVSAGVNWTITDYTKLGITANLGYAYYINDSSRSGVDFSLSPTADNNIGFEVLVGDWHIYIYDSFGVRSDPIRDATVSNTDEIVQFENTLGVLASYELDNSRINTGYGFQKSLFQDSQFADSDSSSHLFHAGYLYSFNPGFSLGLETSATMTIYNSGNQNDTIVYTVGPTLQWQPTDFISITAGGGPSLITYSANNAGYLPSDRSTYYLYSTIDHRFSEFASHALSINQTVAPATQSSDSEILSFNYTITLDIIRDVRLTAGAFYETGDSNSGIVPSSQSFDRVGARLSAARSFGEHVSAGISYEYTHRDSDQLNGDYGQNRVTLTASYRF